MKAFLFVSISCFVVNHVGVVGRFLRAAVLAREREDCGACATLNRRVKPKRRKRFVEAGPAVDDDKFGGLKSRMRLSSNARQTASLSSPMFLIASSTFWPSLRTPSATSNEMKVAFLSRRTRTTVPSRIIRMIGSLMSERAFQASSQKALGQFDHLLETNHPVIAIASESSIPDIGQLTLLTEHNCKRFGSQLISC